MEQDFCTLYESLKPALAQLETRRLELKAQGTKNGSIAAGICCLLGIAVTLCTGMNWAWLLVSAIIGGIIFFYCIQIKSGELTSLYKQNIISAILTRQCSGATFEPDKGISENTFVGSGLFAVSPDRYHSEDLISGKIGTTSFLCSEIHAEEKRVTTNGKGQTRTTWVDIFKGFFFIADFHKDFKGQTTIYRNSWIKLRFGEQRVKLENPEFENSFDVYSDNQIEARYLITPGMMERLLDLDRKFPGKITVSFRNSNVIIAIPDSTDHFEARIWQSMLNDGNLKREFNILCLLLGIIDDLSLNLRIWSKE